jgi:hypothetical protein
MKRSSLLALTALALLWGRQLRFERRLSNRQRRWEREATRGINGIFERQVGEIEGVLKGWHQQISTHLEAPVSSEAFEKAVSDAARPGGARR